MRILVVEDDIRLADLLARSLREAGYAVDVAHDGDAAVTHVEMNGYDGIVLDVALSRRDGFAVSREVRNGGSMVPNLMLTARDSVRDRVEGLDAGADDYLVKPFDLTELLARVRALLRHMPALSPSQIVIGDLVIDVAAQGVSRGGSVVAAWCR